MSQRTDRVDELLRQEIGAILAREVADPRIGFATVTDVETTSDLSHAKVWVSVIGDAAERRETLAALDRAMGFVRRELGVRRCGSLYGDGLGPLRRQISEHDRTSLRPRSHPTRRQ